MDNSTLNQLLKQLPPDTEPRLVEMFIVVHTELPRLPDRFECSMLYSPEDWEQIDPGIRKSIGQDLSKLASKPYSPIRRDGITSSRHNRYKRR